MALDPIATPIAATSFSDASFDAGLSPDALMAYLEARLSTLDEQVKGIFNEEQKQEKIQQAMNNLKAQLNRLPAKGDAPGDMPRDVMDKMHEAISQLTEADRLLGAQVEAELSQVGGGLIFDHPQNPDNTIDTQYNGNEVARTKEYISGLAENASNQSQMNMIHLQSIMSSRQTAIQLSTNLVSSLAESSKGIVANIR